ncbi:MAG: hypothetical protein V1837_02250 [Candidatus Woesearchaeota archaeon]
MIIQVKTDILAVLNQAAEDISKRDLAALSSLSNHTIHNASIFQDEDSVTVAVVVYALSKVLAREHMSIDEDIISKLEKASDFLSEDNLRKYKDCMHDITKLISGVDDKLKLYIEEVIRQAQIRKGSKIYEHGISLARASEMLGISQWELMGYVGNTQFVDRTEKLRRERARLAFARRLFRI